MRRTNNIREIIPHPEEPKIELDQYYKELVSVREWLVTEIKPLHEDVVNKTKLLENNTDLMPSLIEARKAIYEAVTKAAKNFRLLQTSTPLKNQDFEIYANKMGYKAEMFDLVPKIKDAYHSFNYVGYLEKLTRAISIIDKFLQPKRENK